MKKWNSWNCHDCGAEEGQFHIRGCDMERCPFCSGQLITCDCSYKKLNIDYSEGTWTYSHGLTKEQSETWEKMLSKKGRIPYLLIPNHCALCGMQWPEIFKVPDREWKHYVIPPLQREILCQECYDELKLIFPEGWKGARRAGTWNY